MALLSLALTFAVAWFATLRLRTYLHAFQQEEYDARRLLVWWWEKRAFDRWATLGILIAAPFGLFQPHAPALATTLWLLWRGRQEPNPTQNGKKPLVLTLRATKVWLLAAVLVLPPMALLAAPTLHVTLLVALLIQVLPLFLVLANALLWPFQVRQNQRYLKEAHHILDHLNPTVIGLTGSFGKTSTKYILNHILGTQAPTLATPGSVNTPLGIARVVREQLQPHHAYFLAEMGAYGPGSIARLCRLAPPCISCITALGPAHYERFKSLATVAAAKFEIAAATHAQGGACVLSVDAMPDDLWTPYVHANPSGYRLVTARAELIRPGDYYIEKAHETPKGLALTISHNGKATSFQTPLYGEAQIGNLATAFAVAVELGAQPAALAAAMASVQPAPHRLNVQQAGTQTIIDDSYNANPAGFRMALRTLTLIAGANAKNKTPARRRVLLTPGMVELGALHAEEHTKLGVLAVQNADVILAIASQRMPSFVESVRNAWNLTTKPTSLNIGGHQWQTSDGKILAELPTLAAARAWMQVHGQPTDIILIANDLPDRYEARWTL